MTLYHTILELAAERYDDARRHQNGSTDRAAYVGYVTEQIMLTFCSDTEESLYSECDDEELNRVAEFVADGYGMKLSEVIA